MMHGVPAANALLMAAPDLGAAHFVSAFRTALVAMDHAPNGVSDRSIIEQVPKPVDETHRWGRRARRRGYNT